MALVMRGLWFHEAFPAHVVAERPDGSLATFRLSPFRAVTEDECEPYFGSHPARHGGVAVVPAVWRFYGIEKPAPPDRHCVPKPEGACGDWPDRCWSCGGCDDCGRKDECASCCNVCGYAGTDGSEEGRAWKEEQHRLFMATGGREGAVLAPRTTWKIINKNKDKVC